MLVKRLTDQPTEPANHLCFGTLLSRDQYLHDLQKLGYADARLPPYGTMTREDLRIWTDAIGRT